MGHVKHFSRLIVERAGRVSLTRHPPACRDWRGRCQQVPTVSSNKGEETSSGQTVAALVTSLPGGSPTGSAQWRTRLTVSAVMEWFQLAHSSLFCEQRTDKPAEALLRKTPKHRCADGSPGYAALNGCSTDLYPVAEEFPGRTSHSGTRYCAAQICQTRNCWES